MDRGDGRRRERRHGDFRRTPEEAFENATLNLAMEGIHIDAESVPPLTGYRDGTLTYAQAVEAMRRRHAKEGTT